MLPDPIENLYDHLPWFIQLPLYITVNVVLIRGILGNKISQELQDRGVLNALKLKFSKWELLGRKAAIIQHYRYQARGVGHNSHSVLDCHQGRCTIF